MKGKVGGWELAFETAPRGPRGSARVRVGDSKEALEVRWNQDENGIWIELPGGVHGFDVSGSLNDDGVMAYRLVERYGSGEWTGLEFSRGGAEAAAASASGAKRAVRVRAQMPGKIVRVLAKAGDTVEKDQPLLVMEAMKMENEIRSPASGRIKDLKVVEGQAVESGADLALLE